MTDEQKAAARERNRAALPNIASIMDDVKAAFGDGAKLAWAVDEQTNNCVGIRRGGPVSVDDLTDAEVEELADRQQQIKDTL